jgi:outer membrane protein assembly factor BamB
MEKFHSLPVSFWSRQRALLVFLTIFLLITPSFFRHLMAADPVPTTLFRDSKLRDRLVAWERVAEIAAASQRVELLLTILAWPHDAFERLPGGHFGSVKRWATDRLEELPENELRDYRQQWNGRAADERARVGDSGSVTLQMARIARRYPVTPQSEQAAERAILQLLEVGDIDLARRFWLRFLHSGNEQRNDQRPSSLNELFQAAPQQGSGLYGKPPEIVRDSSAISQLLAWTRRASAYLDENDQPIEDWLSVRGAVSRSRQQPGSLPSPRSVWTKSLIERTPVELFGAYLDRWAVQQRDADRLANTAQFAVVAGDQILLRDSQGVISVDVAGNPRWEWMSKSSLGALFQELETITGKKPQGLPTIAATIEPQEFVGANTIQGVMSSDRRRLYLIDDLTFNTARAIPSPQFRQFGEARLVGGATNRLVALDLWATDDAHRLLWSIGGKKSSNSNGSRPPAADSDPSTGINDFEGHYFLGAPVVTPSELLVLTEFDRQIILSSLDPVTGGLLWKQPLAFADQLVSEERDRFFQACIPAVGRGIAVCPTRTGIIVAFDLATHQLLWHTKEFEQGPEMNGRFGNAGSHRRGARGMLDGPLIHEDRVFCLPDTSDFIRCFNLETGEVHWTRHRMDGEYIGAVDGKVVVVVGRQQTRGLSFADGTELWKVNTGLPSGTGVQLGDRFVLPLDDGRFGTLEMSTGTYRSHAVPEEGSGLGNLIPAGDLLLSVGLKELRAFPQAMARLSVLERGQAQGSNDPESDLERAELESVLGRTDRVEAAVVAAMKGPLTPASRERAHRLLRNTLSLQLYEGKRPAREILALLKPLAISQSDKLHDVAWLSKICLEERDVKGLAASLDTLIQLPEDALTIAPGDPVLQVSATAWCERLSTLLSSGKVPGREQPISEFQAIHEDFVDRWVAAAARVNNLALSRRWLAIAGEHPRRAEVVSQMTELLMATGELHAAECLLNTEIRRQSTVASVESLSNLYEVAGYPASAREARRHHLSSGATVKIPPATGRSSGERDVLQVQITVRTGQGLGSVITDWSGKAGTVKQPEYRIEKSPYLENRRRSFPPAGFPVDALVVGDEQNSRLMLFDKATGGNARFTSIEGRYNAPSAGSQAFQGHAITMGQPGGISLLSVLQQGESGLVWNCRLPDRKGQSITPAYGPAGASFLTVQSQQRLYMINPATGQLCWRRDDLEPLSGLQADLNAGIFGDEEVLVVRGPDRLDYMLLDTATGRKIDSGRITQELRQASYLFGRKLFSIATDAENKNRLRLWDPIGQKRQIDEPTGDRILFNRVGEHEIAFINGQRELKIYDVRGPELKASIPLSQGEYDGIVQIRCFADRDRYYVNFGRSMIVVTSQHHNNQMNDGFIPSIGVRDDLMAIDKRTGESLWVRAVPNRSVLNHPDLPSDLLLMASRVRDRDDGNLEWLMVEVIDARTGATLAMKDGIRLRFGLFLPDRNGGSSENDRLVAATHREDLNLITLHGVEKAIDIRYVRRSPMAVDQILPSR